MHDVMFVPTMVQYSYSWTIKEKACNISYGKIYYHTNNAYYMFAHIYTRTFITFKIINMHRFSS